MFGRALLPRETRFLTRWPLATETNLAMASDEDGASTARRLSTNRRGETLIVTKRGKRAPGLLSSLLFVSAEATTVRLTNGVLTGRSGTGTVDVAGSAFALSGNVEILDLIDVTDCILCRPGQFYDPFWSFDLVYDGTLTWKGITHTLDHVVAHGAMSGGFFLPSQLLGPAFSLDLPFTLNITLDGFDFNAVGPGV